MSAQPIKSDSPLAAPPCSNCGAPVDTTYCGVCGQAVTRLDRPIVDLTREILDDTLNWDGRFWQSLQMTYTRPGALARHYLDGRRASFTPPFRLYLLAVLAFISLMSVSGITVFAVTTAQSINDPAYGTPPIQASIGPYRVGIDLFRSASAAPATPVTYDQLVAILHTGSEPAPDRAAFLQSQPPAQRLLIRALNAPDRVEHQLNIALTQALFFMVIGLGVINLVLHPRASIITHGIHSLYLHAAALPFIGIWALVSVPLSSLHPALSTGLAILAAVGLIGYAGWADRRVYNSSLIGLCLRLPALIIGYILVYVLVTVALASWALI